MSALDALSFEPVLITDVFESMKSSAAWYDKVHLKNGSGQNLYLSQTQSMNSVAEIVADQGLDPEPGNCITITLKTQATFYQPVAFYTAQNFLIFRHELLNERNGLFLVTVLRRAMQKFSWGYGVSMARLRKTRIMVPITIDASGEQAVDWEGMTLLGADLFGEVTALSLVTRQTDATDSDALPDLRFDPMFITDLFIPHKGRRLTSADRSSGRTPFVGGSEFNNSITGFSEVDPLFPGGWLTLIYNGSVGRTRFQPAPFFASDDVIALEPKNTQATDAALLVCAAIIERECVGKYSYGFKLNLSRLVRQTIMVPVTTDANNETVVDWDGMSEYGSALRVRAERAMGHVLEEST